MFTTTSGMIVRRRANKPVRVGGALAGCAARRRAPSRAKKNSLSRSSLAALGLSAASRSRGNGVPRLHAKPSAGAASIGRRPAVSPPSARRAAARAPDRPACVGRNAGAPARAQVWRFPPPWALFLALRVGPPQHQHLADMLHGRAIERCARLREHRFARVAVVAQNAHLDEVVREKREVDLVQHRRRQAVVADVTTGSR